MADFIRDNGAGLTCHPAPPASLADVIRQISEGRRTEHLAVRDRTLIAAHGRSDWEARGDTLFVVSRGPLPRGSMVPT